MRIFFSMISTLILFSLAGCTHVAPAGGTSCHCAVCERNGDMACVDVVVTKDTPRTQYNGSTYYFCSDECMKAFSKSPEKYVTPSPGK